MLTARIVAAAGLRDCSKQATPFVLNGSERYNHTSHCFDSDYINST